MMRPRAAAALLAVLAAWVLLHEACDKAQNPLAPSNTVLTITAVPSQISLSGAGARITVLGIRPDGNPIFPGTQITLITNLGVLRPDGVPCSSSAVVDLVEADGQGRAVAQLCGNGRIGDAQVTANLTNVSGGGGGGGTGGEGGSGGGSGTASASVTVRIGETDDSKPSVVISANPTVVAVGGESVISLLGRNADGTPVAADSRIRLTSDLGTVRCGSTFACPGEGTNPCPAVCTDAQGEAEATFVAGDRSGGGEVTAILGTSEPAMVTVDINAALDSLSLELSTTSIERNTEGDDVTLTAILNDTLGTPLRGVLVRFSSQKGQLSQVSVTSDSDGIARSTLTVRASEVADIPQNGQFTVQASATSEGETRTATRQITVLGAP